MLNRVKVVFEKLSPAGNKHAAATVHLRRKISFREENGQTLLILAIAFVALLAFIGLVTDAGSLYITYTQLKRAVDSAAVAAANNVKIHSPGESYASRKEKVTEAAREMLSLNNVVNLTDVEVYTCDDEISEEAKAENQSLADFSAMCPPADQAPRKLAYVKAEQEAPVYFLHLFGLEAVPFSTSAVGEAASVDLVLVIDTSESMASDSCEHAPPGDTDPPCTPDYDPNDFNPAACNLANNCYPLRQAKDAAKNLIARLLPGYDRAAIISYDYHAHIVSGLSSNITGAIAAVDTITVHDDAPAAKLEWSKPSPMGGYRTFNPIFPDDRDGDGLDVDSGAPCIDEIDYRTGAAGKDLWDDNTGEPCDDDAVLDAYDWNGNGDYTDDGDFPFSSYEDTSQVSTCIGCGVRQAVELMRAGGRPDSVWVMVFLSDGIANLSDTNLTNPDIPTSYTYGFCGSDPPTSFWGSYCIDQNEGSSAGRFCLDTASTECPPDSTPTENSGPYSVEDYAYDMIDDAALMESENSHEPMGEDMVIYAIGLDAARAGADILRYMANLGVDGNRDNDACAGMDPQDNCGNYYYAPTGAYLDQIFENIASRIFTKLSR